MASVPVFAFFAASAAMSVMSVVSMAFSFSFFRRLPYSSFFRRWGFRSLIFISPLRCLPTITAITAAVMMSMPPPPPLSPFFALIPQRGLPPEFIPVAGLDVLGVFGVVLNCVMRVVYDFGEEAWHLSGRGRRLS